MKEIERNEIRPIQNEVARLTARYNDLDRDKPHPPENIKYIPKPNSKQQSLSAEEQAARVAKHRERQQERYTRHMAELEASRQQLGNAKADLDTLTERNARWAANGEKKKHNAQRNVAKTEARREEAVAYGEAVANRGPEPGDETGISAWKYQPGGIKPHQPGGKCQRRTVKEKRYVAPPGLNAAGQEVLQEGRELADQERGLPGFISSSDSEAGDYGWGTESESGYETEAQKYPVRRK
jgi:hypothetical protein